MKLKHLNIGKHKNFNNLEIDFTSCNGVSAFIGNNGSGKSNILEALSSIFKSLYNEDKTDEFGYFLEYETFSNTSVKITSNGKNRVFAINGNPVFDIKEYLPKRVIAIYSGEEDRLWKKYYEPVYQNYINGVNQSNVLEYPRMFFLNKFYWNLILLSLLISEADDVKEFVKEKLRIDEVNEIKFKFYKEKYKDYNNSPALSFIKRIDDNDVYTLESFKEKISGDYSQEYNASDFLVHYDSTDVFRALYIAFTPKDKKIIDDIEITFNGTLTLSSLSEGQKKMLLIKATLEFASSEDTLILLDEPDAHIHINNKDQIIKVFEPYQNTRQIVITTHSPTLTQSFSDESVFMLANGELIKKDRQFIINELTKEFWSKQEQNYFLSEVKDTILVEGKTDIAHIETALLKLKSVDDKYKTLNFKYLPFNGASGLKLFVDEFPVNLNTKTFAFLDRDQAGFEAVRETLDFKGTKDEFSGSEKNNIFISYIPKKDGHTKSDFIIEDYYPLNKYKDFLFENVSCVTEMPNHSSSRFKVKFAEKAKEFDIADFDGFKKIFDLILSKKNINNYSPIVATETTKASKRNTTISKNTTKNVIHDALGPKIKDKMFKSNLDIITEPLINENTNEKKKTLKIATNKYLMKIEDSPTKQINKSNIYTDKPTPSNLVEDQILKQIKEPLVLYQWLFY